MIKEFNRLDQSALKLFVYFEGTQNSRLLSGTIAVQLKKNSSDLIVSSKLVGQIMYQIELTK